jgi:hypothetical protein
MQYPGEADPPGGHYLKEHFRRKRIAIRCAALVITVVSWLCKIIQNLGGDANKQLKTSLSLFPSKPRFSPCPTCQVKLRDPNMSLCYFVSHGANFGDELGPAAVKRILEDYFGCHTDIQAINLATTSRKGHKCLFSLGSIFHMVEIGSHVWGTGINPTLQGGALIVAKRTGVDKSLEAAIQIHSVRGPKTAEQLQELQLVDNADEILHGDPGFLIPFLYAQYLPTTSLSQLGICFVPHAQDLNCSEIKDPPAGLRILTVKQHWETMIAQLRTCKCIVSTSLHGIVVGDALGIPTLWFQFPGGKTEKTEESFEYQDYFESIGRTGVFKPTNSFDMAVFQNEQNYMKPMPIQRRKILVKKFMSSFPYHLFREVQFPDYKLLEVTSTTEAVSQPEMIKVVKMPPTLSPPTESNSSLVIIIGNLRGGEQAWGTLYKNVLDINSADLALMIGQNNSTSHNLYSNSSLYNRAKYIFTFAEYDDWADALDLIYGTVWREMHLPYFAKKSSHTGLLGGVKGYPGSGAIIFMIRWFLSQQLLTYPDILNQYERFVITRADHYYQCPHEYHSLDLSDNTMWVPQGEDWGGYTDRHLIVSRSNVLDALDIFPTLLGRPGEELGEWMGSGKNPERALQFVWSLKGLKVKSIKRVMFTVATPFDTTRWRQAENIVPGVPGLLKKYEKEYDLTQSNCPKNMTSTN